MHSFLCLLWLWPLLMQPHRSIIRIVLSPFGEYGWMKFTCISSLRCSSRCVSVQVFAYRSMFVWTSYWSPVTETPQRRMRHPDEAVRKEKINGEVMRCGERGLTHTVIQIMGGGVDVAVRPRSKKENFDFRQLTPYKNFHVLSWLCIIPTYHHVFHLTWLENGGWHRICLYFSDV